MNNALKRLLFILLFSMFGINSNAAGNEILFEMAYFEDVNHIKEISEIKNEQFHSLNNHVGSFGITKSTYWVKISLDTKTVNNEAILDINRPFLDEIIIYYSLKNGRNITDTLGIQYPNTKNKIN